MDQAPPPIAEMPFLDHLEELRWRIVWILGALAVGMMIAFALLTKVDIIRLLETPVLPYLQGRTLVFTHPGDPFQIVLNASLLFGLVLASPVIVYQVWAFLSPALYSHEKRVIIPVLMGGVLLFMGGVALSFFVVLPFTLGFLLTFQTQSLTPMITAADYFGFAISMSLALGITFELPIVMVALTALGVITPEFLNRYRRHAVVSCIVGAALITPGADPTSLFAIALPLYFLFELSVVLSSLVDRSRRRREAKREAEERALAEAEAAAALAARPEYAPAVEAALRDDASHARLDADEVEGRPRSLLDERGPARPPSVPLDQMGLS